ncbi:MAG: hypothetical protein JEZ06_00270 [Anaerolineaceae bacterium]|nr:hypothetical protein [Anaerolineaceae bacterium]
MVIRRCIFIKRCLTISQADIDSAIPRTSPARKHSTWLQKQPIATKWGSGLQPLHLQCQKHPILPRSLLPSQPGTPQQATQIVIPHTRTFASHMHPRIWTAEISPIAASRLLAPIPTTSTVITTE